MLFYTVVLGIGFELQITNFACPVTFFKATFSSTKRTTGTFIISHSIPRAISSNFNVYFHMNVYKSEDKMQLGLIQ